MRQEFEKELKELINRHSMESYSETPDYILAQYLSYCLAIYDKTIAARDKWHGFEPWNKKQSVEQKSDESAEDLPQTVEGEGGV